MTSEETWLDVINEGLESIQDPADRARRASALIDEHQTAIAELSRVRREALDELVSSGLTQAQVAGLIGMTRARVGQLLSSGPRPERAMLGTGPLTVAIGGKLEADKKPEPYAVVSSEMLTAYERVAALAQTLGLKAESEVIPPPGMVDLNRANLIVVGGPRILPFVGQVLASDPNIGFASDSNDLYLVNRQSGESYRSRRDKGKGTDYGYIGRLPRPDGRGNFLYLAGIHSMGTLGVIQYLEEHLEELHKEVKNRRFSLLVACRYDTRTRTVKSTEAASPVYRNDGVAS